MSSNIEPASSPGLAPPNYATAMDSSKENPAVPVVNHNADDSDAEPYRKKKFGQVDGVGLIFACGAALFSDGYVNAISGSVNLILTSYIYKGDPRNKKFKQLFTALAFAGTVVGMLIFGVLADKLGRKQGMIVASFILIVFSILASAAKGAGGSLGGMYAALEAYRFLIGIGIGAEYPAGSVACSENTEDKSVNPKRQQMYFSLATNTMIDWGFVFASFVPLVVLWIFGMDHLRAVWRISLGLGAVPPLILLFFRFRMHETAAFQKGAVKKHSSWKDLSRFWVLVIRRYWVRFAAVCLAWFIYDYVSYPAGLFSSVIVDRIIPNGTLYEVLGWNVVINLFYIPGTILGALVNDRIGPKNTMILGLVLQAVFGFALAGSFDKLQNHVAPFAVLYGIYLSFGEFGPGNNLGLLASKSVAPTAVRGTVYGLCAAVGKIGAFSGTYAYPEIIDDFSRYPDGANLQTSGPVYIGSGLALLSAAIVFFFIPPVVQDGMKHEDAAFKLYLEQNGYDTSEMGLPAEEREAELESDSIDTEKIKVDGKAPASFEAPVVTTNAV